MDLNTSRFGITGNLPNRSSNLGMANCVMKNLNMETSTINRLTTITGTITNLAVTNLIVSNIFTGPTGSSSTTFTPAYGYFYTNSNVDITVTNTSKITINTTGTIAGMSLSGDTDMTIDATGVYSVNWSVYAEFTDVGGGSNLAASFRNASTVYDERMNRIDLATDTAVMTLPISGSYIGTLSGVVYLTNSSGVTMTVKGLGASRKSVAVTIIRIA